MKSLAIRLATLGENHSSTATSYFNIGHLYYKKKENSKALEYLKKGHAIYLFTIGSATHPFTVNCQSWIDTVNK